MLELSIKEINDQKKIRVSQHDRIFPNEMKDSVGYFLRGYFLKGHFPGYKNASLSWDR